MYDIIRNPDINTLHRQYESDIWYEEDFDEDFDEDYQRSYIGYEKYLKLKKIKKFKVINTTIRIPAKPVDDDDIPF